MSSHRTPAASAASSTAATLFREIRCEAAIARPDRPSARNRSTSLALIFLTIENCSFRRVPFTPGGRSLSRWLRTTITVAPKTANASTGHRLPTPIRVDLSTPNIHGESRASTTQGFLTGQDARSQAWGTCPRVEEGRIDDPVRWIPTS
ncbi:hypothetical protein ACFFX0_30710 [Citricoccus parietis]|uniref:Uncharacterized protein n=1 Tax=Citricoccus parietis TaxID=592307 RepID=A0ABV5G8P4_9MICC